MSVLIYLTSPLEQQIDVIYCAKGSICSRRSKATVLSRRENRVNQNGRLNDAVTAHGAANNTNKNRLLHHKVVFDNASREVDLKMFYCIGNIKF